MPWPSLEKSVRWISTGSASTSGLCCCLDQYCITMAMLAAPQPSFSCLTNGTSSHTPGPSAASITPQRQRAANNFFITAPLAHGHDDQDEGRNSHDNPDQVAVAELATGKVGLGLVRAGGKLRQVFIAQRGNGGLDLLRIHPGGFERLLRRRSREKFVQRIQVVLPDLGDMGHLFLQVSRADYMILRQGVRRDGKEDDKQTSNQSSNRLPRTKR